MAQTDDLDDKIRLLKAAQFPHHSQSCHRVNNGSFGSAPQLVLEVQKMFRAKWLSQPDEFLYDPENGFWPNIKRSICALGPIVNCPKPYHQHLCLIENATTAANTIAQALMWKFTEGLYKRDDVVIMFSFTYYAVQNAFRTYPERAGAKLVKIDIPFPLPLENGEDFVVEKLKAGLDAIDTPIRMVVLDHISSMPSMVLPLKRMIQVCRAKGADYVIVDGAHAIGNVPIDLEELDADFYFSNCHKWLFNPAAVAFLYSRVPFNTGKSEKTLEMHHPIAGHLFNQGILGESAYTGTKDYSPFFTVPNAIEFASSVIEKFLVPSDKSGLESLRNYNHSRLLEFCSMLAGSWGTQLAVPPSMCCSMAMLALPAEITLKTKLEADGLRNLLRSQYKVEIPICTTGSAAFVRLSHQVYNTAEDYRALGDAVLQIVKQIKNGESLEEMLEGHITYDWNMSALKIF